MKRSDQPVRILEVPSVNMRAAQRFQLFVFMAMLLMSIAVPEALAREPERWISQYSFSSWDREHGLLQNSVRAITQDKDGYLWVGTEEGLARFDGVRFVKFPLESSDGREDGYINVLFRDGDLVWAGSPTGLYRGGAGRFVEVLQTNGEAVGDVRALFRDSSGTLWIGTRQGLLYMENGRARMDDHQYSWVTGITEFEGRLCIASGTVWCREGDQFRVADQFPLAQAEPLFNRVAFDHDGALWASTTLGGVVRLANGKLTRWGASHGIPDGWVKALVTDAEGNLWIGCGRSGVVRLNDGKVEVHELPMGQSPPEILSLFPDREGNIWIGTNGGGLACLRATPFIPFSSAEGLQEPSVTSILEDQRGTLWIGTGGGGLHRLEGGKIKVENALPSHDILALAEDGSGRLWVGTADAGIFVLENKRFRRVKGYRSVVFSLLEDGGGQMWAGGIGAVFRLRESRFERVDGFGRLNASSMIKLGDELWFANGLGGLYRWRQGRVDRFGKEQGVPGDMLIALYADDSGGLWVGSHMAGLTRFDGQSAFTFTTEHGLCGNSVFSITEGPSHHLWMTSNVGVFAVARDQLEAVARGEADSVECRLFGTADGMRSSECNGGQQPSAWRDREDRLWFATIDGAVRVDPGVISETPPPVMIEEIRVDGTVYEALSTGEIEIPPGRGELSVLFTAINFQTVGRLQFRYRLEGLDGDWVEVGGRERRAYFTSLPPRRYTLRVQVRWPDASWAEPGRVVALHLRPRFVETRWFVLLIVFAVSLLGALAHYGRVTILRRQKRHLENLVATRTRELAEINQTLERRVEEGVEALRESDRAAAYGLLVAGVAHEVRHPIFALRAAGHLLSSKLAADENTREELGVLERETERMSRLIDDLLELGHPRELDLRACAPESLIEEAMASITAHPDMILECVTSIDQGLPHVLADRPAVVQVLVNLVHNANRHAFGASRVVVSASVEQLDNRIVLAVIDDGKGISSEDQERIFEPFYSGAGGTGLGLAIAYRLVREHGGLLSVQSTEGEGAILSIRLRIAD